MRIGPLAGILPLLCCYKHVSRAASTSLLSGIRSRSIPYPFRSNPLNILVLFLQVVWIAEFTRPNCRNTSAFLFSISPVTLNVPWTWLVALAVVSVDQSPVSAGVEK